MSNDTTWLDRQIRGGGDPHREFYRYAKGSGLTPAILRDALQAWKGPGPYPLTVSQSLYHYAKAVAQEVCGDDFAAQVRVVIG
jgi:hypothetical protein